MADVEMKPAADDKSKTETETTAAPPPPPTPVQEIKANAVLIEKAVSSLEPRYTHRVLRTLNVLRRKLDDGVLRDAIGEVYPKGVCIEEYYHLPFQLTRHHRACSQEVPPRNPARCTSKGGCIYGH